MGCLTVAGYILGVVDYMFGLVDYNHILSFEFHIVGLDYRAVHIVVGEEHHRIVGGKAVHFQAEVDMLAGM